MKNLRLETWLRDQTPWQFTRATDHNVWLLIAHGLVYPLEEQGDELHNRLLDVLEEDFA